MLLHEFINTLYTVLLTTSNILTQGGGVVL
jgi:hypothetical protein